ncbi:hypothetical protein E05_35130 [Plautia stali symbiont]|nr:hypothetical protein E05_35130 [Plautia stali symbiont]
MIPTMMNTHKAFKALQQAGVADHQAEVMVDIFAEMQQENSLTKTHLSQAMEGVMRAKHTTAQRVDKLAQSLGHFENEVRHTFKAIELRFDNVDEQFRQIDKRFEKVDERLVMAMASAFVLSAAKYILPVSRAASPGCASGLT